MATAACSFAAVVGGTESADAIRNRAERLCAFYRPCGLTALSLATPAPGVVIGTIAAETRCLDERSGVIPWGAALPASLQSAAALLAASDEQLRALAPGGAAFAWDEERIRILSGPAGPTALYAAATGDTTVYATHAVAAAVLAGLRLTIDSEAVPQFIAFDFVGGERTLLDGVSAVAPAVVISIPGAATSYWPAEGRWQRVPAPDAYAHTRDALLASLRERTDGQYVSIGLTAGLDSTAGAVALRDCDLELSAFTWGDPDWPDAAGAAQTAAELGIAHRVTGAARLPDAEVLATLDRDARWCDGVTALTATTRIWPDDAPLLAVGMGGETGRAFYYGAWDALLTPRPSPERLVRQLGVSGRLLGAPEEVVDAVKAAVAGWIEDAQSVGARGWDVLDVVYAEQRVRRWGRSQLPPLEQELLLLFTPVEVTRGLFSHPQADRLGDGFQRRFIAEHCVALARPAKDVPTPGRASLAARRALYRASAPLEPIGDEPVDTLLRAFWSELPEASAFVHEEVLAHPLIDWTLGADWAIRTSHGFRAGHRHSSGRALRAAGVVALARALAEFEKVGAAGIEPAISGVKGRRPNR